jgi:CsoR family transcriptional regulator, copper-sensing transcriptional repressor
MTGAETPIPAACGCGAGTDPESRRPVAVDPTIKERNQKRLRRIEGQIRGLQRMVDEDRYCPDIMMQIASAQQALRSVGRELMRNHLKHCVATAVKTSDAKADQIFEELLELVYSSK